MTALSISDLTYAASRAIRNGAVASMLWILPVNAEQLTIAALGDSLTAGYGLAPAEGFVPQLQAWLLARGADVVVQNAGVSGDTTAGGVARLDWTLTPDVDALIVTLGGNDLLRGIDPAESRANLETILKSATARGLPVLMIGMQAPGNYGPEYKISFDAIYPELSSQYETLFAPAFFAGLGSDPALVQEFMQADGLHPNFAGVTKIVENLGPSVQALLQKIPQ